MMNVLSNFNSKNMKRLFLVVLFFSLKIIGQSTNYYTGVYYQTTDTAYINNSQTLADTALPTESTPIQNVTDTVINPYKDLNIDLPVVSNYQKPHTYISGADLMIKDSKGNIIYDFTESPCFGEIGFMINLTKEQNLARFRDCESRKRNEAIINALPYLAGLVLIILGIWLVSYFKNINKNRWRQLRNKYDTDEYFIQIINDFLIEDNISFEKYHQNEKVDSNKNLKSTYCKFK
jgi:hypothetical protein